MAASISMRGGRANRRIFRGQYAARASWFNGRVCGRRTIALAGCVPSRGVLFLDLDADADGRESSCAVAVIRQRGFREGGMLQWVRVGEGTNKLSGYEGQNTGTTVTRKKRFSKPKVVAWWSSLLQC